MRNLLTLRPAREERVGCLASLGGNWQARARVGRGAAVPWTQLLWPAAWRGGPGISPGWATGVRRGSTGTASQPDPFPLHFAAGESNRRLPPRRIF